jgi:hypothetical protein
MIKVPEHVLSSLAADLKLINLDLFMNYRRMLIFTVSQGRLKDKPEDKDRWKRMILYPPEIIEQAL